MRRMKLIGGLLCIAGGLVAWQVTASPEPVATAAASEADPALSLKYRYSGGQAGRDAIVAAVEAATEDMNVLIRGIARKRLLEANAVMESLSFSLEGDPVVATYVGGRVISAPRSGKSVTWTDQYGERIAVSHRVEGGKLIQTMRGTNGRRKNVYNFSDGGKAMTLSVEIAADQLPAPVRYRVAYRRDE